MMNLKAITAIVFAAALLWSTTAIAHPSQASGSSHGHHSTSSGACAYSCVLLGHGSSAYTGGSCGTCTCWG